MEIKEEQKVSANNEKTDSRILFKHDISSQNVQNHLDAHGNSVKPRFESVFDTLRIFENQNGKKPLNFKWTKKIVKKTDLKTKIKAQCPQCVLQHNKLLGHGSFEDMNIVSSPMNYPKNSQTRGGWLLILKIPESNLVLGDDSSQTMVLNTQILMTGKKHYCIYLKGKIYRFDNEHTEESTKVLNIKNCNMDMITIQRPDQTVAQSVSCNLEQGIQVRSLNKSYLFLSSAKGDNYNKRKDIQDWFEFYKKFGILLNMKSYYEIGQLLGKGNFAKVYEATNFKTKEKFALKTIEKKMISKNRRNFFALLQEVALLRRLDHQNIIHLHEVYESENNIHLILEYLNGGELFERIKKNGSYNEKDASVIMRCILDALVAMHDKQIVHRDLKPENLLFKNDEIGSLKIVDFGLSTLMKDGPLNMRCGSPGYVAPEVLNDLGYGTKADIFSAGIILYILLTGKFVFSGKNYREILLKNKECLVPFPPQYWTNLTSEAKDLVKKMLEKDANNRLTAAEALDHPWFKLNGINLQNLELNFQEVDEVVLTDEEPSLTNSVNLQLITTSPIWNKTKMRDEIRKVNAEQDKINTFQTPLPQPKFFGSKRLQENVGKSKIIGGVVLQNLYNNQNQSAQKQDNSLQALKKQHQTPNARPESKQQTSKPQNSTLNMLQQLFRTQQKPEEQPISKDEEWKSNYLDKNIDDSRLQPTQLNASNYSQKSLMNQSSSNNQTNNNSINNSQNPVMKSQDVTQTSTPNQQNSTLQQASQLEPQIDMFLKKWLEPNICALSLINEDFLEDAKSINQYFGSLVNQNDPNFQQMKNKAVLAFRQFSQEQERARQLRFDSNKINQLNQSQSMHFQQIHDFLIKDILPPDENQISSQKEQNDPSPQPFYPFNPSRQPILQQQPNLIYNRQSPGPNKGMLPVVLEEDIDEQQKKRNRYLDSLNQIKNEKQYNNNEDDDESLGELEIEENAGGLIDQNKIVDFNAHSNIVLMKSSTANELKSSGGLYGYNNIQQQSAPYKIDIDQQNISNIRPANPSSISVNSNSLFLNSKQSNFFINNSNSSDQKSQHINDHFSSNNASNSNNLVQHQQQPQVKKQIVKNQRKSQFWQNSLNLHGEASDNINEEANVDGHIDTEEQVVNNFFHVPTTPGSIYGGSRNIMKHSLNFTPFNKYLEQPKITKTSIIQNSNSKAVNSNPMHQSSKSSQNQNGSRPGDLQPNITFNNSQYFNKEIHTKSDISNKKYQQMNTNQLLYDEEIKEDYSPLNNKEIELFGSDNNGRGLGKSKNSQLIGLIKQELKDSTQRSDSIKYGFNVTPDAESSNDGLQRQIREINQKQMQYQMAQKKNNMIPGFDSTQNQQPQQQQIFFQNSINAGDSMLNHENFRRSIMNGSHNADDKSVVEYHTAYQSMADIQDLKNQNRSAQNNSSWQNPHYSVNEVSNKSLQDMNNKSSQGQIYTEQNLNDQKIQRQCGSNDFGLQQNLSQEVLKHQNSYNLGESKNKKLKMVNDARKNLIKNI